MVGYKRYRSKSQSRRRAVMGKRGYRKYRRYGSKRTTYGIKRYAGVGSHFTSNSLSAPKRLAIKSVEIKTWDTTINAQVSNGGSSGAPYYGWTGGRIDTVAPSTLGALNSPGQGTTFQSREGMMIRGHSLHVKGIMYRLLYGGRSTPDADTSFLVALVLDTQSFQTTAASELIFANPGSVGPHGFQRNMYGDPKRFRILTCKVIPYKCDSPSADPISAATYVVPYRAVPWELFVDLRGLSTVFTSLSGPAAYSTYADIVKNCINLYAWQAQAYQANTANAWAIDANARYRFVG